jgi:hypothetical protein
VQTFADGVGFHAQADEVVGVEVVQGLFTGYRHSFIVEENRAARPAGLQRQGVWAAS